MRFDSLILDSLFFGRLIIRKQTFIAKEMNVNGRRGRRSTRGFVPTTLQCVRRVGDAKAADSQTSNSTPRMENTAKCKIAK